MLDNNVPRRLKLLMTNLGLSQKDLSDKSDLTECAVSKYMSGERIPNAGSLIKIAHATGVSPNWILGFGSDDEMEKI